MVQYEQYDQINVISWAKLHEWKWPELKLLMHIPNGGKRDVRTAAMLKASGVKAGVPDLLLPVPRGNYHGLWIELKHGKNKASELQKQWLADLKEQGYKTAIAVGFDEAVEVLQDYMDLDKKICGTYECFHCGHRTVIWGNDFTLEDYGYDGEGIVHDLSCANCGAEIQYIIREDEEEDEDEGSEQD